MVYFVIALLSEARPLINHYRLKLRAPEGPFRIYEGGDKRLIVSGTGKIRAASAATFLHVFSGGARNQVWLNIGIGGHSERALGEGVLAHKITDQASGKTWYPPLVIKAPCATESIRTVDRAETEYQERCVYEMEAAGFYDTASHFSTAELIQCYKVISDNRGSDPLRVGARHASPLRVEKLIGRRLAEIDTILKEVNGLASELTILDTPVPEFQKFFERWHFTVSQQYQLRRLLARLKTLQPKAKVWPEIQTLSSSKDVLNFLKDRINLLPVRL